MLATIRTVTAAALSALALGLGSLAAHGALPDPVQFGVAIERGDVKTVRAWLDQGLPPDYLADRIGTGLMIASWEGNIEMMELFVSRVANVNSRTSRRWSGMTMPLLSIGRSDFNRSRCWPPRAGGTEK